ncbi:hypothetical protein CONLIGDRAFT_650193 [Coniochaeta ligniaria NRRL 30616]|uniref:Uncharacterized protein n=1 Tax=Coniochaeta ligniaria NRRL 30616 TaxID=1408157 RepID=A0A1J7I5E4_9PEZI|nr:hypothetical protein CONLIGDRAFT_650193 [Coniochaeta ligniaria NRRL 30616]
MSIAASLGPNSLIQLGVSLSDIALLFDQGRKFGNWLTVKRHDADLFETLMETPDVLLKRKGLVDPVRMESRFPGTEFFNNGERVSSTTTKHQELLPFSWLMVVITSVLDLCLPPEQILQVMVEVFVRLLDNEEAEGSLRLSLGVNIGSWRSVARVRRVMPEIIGYYGKAWKEKAHIAAIPELNESERQEMIRFLECLLGNDCRDFTCVSAATFAAARAIERIGVTINSTRDSRTFETQLTVRYLSETTPLAWNGAGKHHPSEYEDPVKLQRGLRIKAQIVSYPAGHPESMINAVQASRETLNQKKHMWELGTRGAARVRLVAAADLPYSPEQEPYYQLDDDADTVVESFDAFHSILASKAFPHSSQAVLQAIDSLTEGQDSHRKEWLEMHVGLEYLLKSESEIPSRRQENLSLWLPYQALVFGFYYKLLEPLVSLEFVFDKDAYFCGLWGYGGTTFLAMCTQFGQEFRRNGEGRTKRYSPGHSRPNLIGVLGPVSVLTLSLLRTSDSPQELAKFAVLNLPVVQLVPDEEGELYASTAGSGIKFTSNAAQPMRIRPEGPSKQWSVHSTMGKSFRGGGAGVVMAARCEGRLVGWFSPAAAEVMFLSTAYCKQQHSDDENYVDETCVSGFEVRDRDWQQGSVQRPTDANLNTLGLVHSAGCPVLRYAAAGFYGGAGEEVAIATDDLAVALGRVELIDSGILIA